MQNKYINSINNALAKLSETKSISSAIIVCNTLLEYMGFETKNPDDIELSKLKLPNAERYDRWFHQHPYRRSDRACFELLDKNELLEAKLYSIQKKSKLVIAGAVNFTPNFEDRDYTRNDPSMKVGIDFFLTPEKNSVLVVLSNRGMLRLVELADKLTTTQALEIFNLWNNISQERNRHVFHSTIWESFKLSSLNKKFYEGIAERFTTLTQHLKDKGVEEQIANQFTNRLLGRLLFLWFLRKKKIINESKGYFDIDEIDDTDYYHKTLSTLFFKILNNEDHSKLDPITPYLNGGLFDENADGEYWKKHKVTFPKGFFHGLYEHFNSFNFTTDESTPEYEQIAIDPEMLGRIFESFLATLKTETGEQAKKANGAFYTPREIVSYMSRESLRQYLYTSLEANVNLKQSIDDLLDRSDSDWALAGTNSKRDVATKEEANLILSALERLTVLDPSVGSGAFPIGMLHQILNLYERLDSKFDAYEAKLNILRKNIYGVDIDPTAIEISRLRAWLSLIVEVEDIKKIKPLPNLDFKFVCANSLIGLEGEELKEGINTTKKIKITQTSFGLDPDLKTKLMKIRDDYYATSNINKKAKLQSEYIKLTHQQGILDSKRIQQLKSYKPFTDNEAADFYDPELMHGIDSFDIIIGNPPYLESRHKSFKPELKDALQKSVKERWGKKDSELLQRGADLLIYFFEFSCTIVKPNGIITLITQNSWLDTDYGKSFQNFITTKTNVLGVIDSDFKYFAGANTNTVITFFKGNSLTPGNEIIFKRYHDRFDKIPFNSSKKDIIEKDLSISTTNQFKQDCSELKKYKWGLLLSAGDKLFLNLLQTLETLGKRADEINLDRGISIGQGVNLTKDYFVNEEIINLYALNKEALIPLFSNEDGAPFQVQSTKLFLIREDKIDKTLKKTLVKNKIKTYKITKSRKEPALILPRGISRYFCAFNTCDCHSTSFVEIYSNANKEEDILNLWLFLNSTIGWLIREVSGRKNLGGGLLKAEATDLKSFPIFFNFNSTQKIQKIYQQITKREAFQPLEEIVTEEHIAIDNLVFEHLGIDSNTKDQIIELFIAKASQRIKRSKSKT